MKVFRNPKLSLIATSICILCTNAYAVKKGHRISGNKRGVFSRVFKEPVGRLKDWYDRKGREPLLALTSEEHAAALKSKKDIQKLIQDRANEACEGYVAIDVQWEEVDISDAVDSKSRPSVEVFRIDEDGDLGTVSVPLKKGKAYFQNRIKGDPVRISKEDFDELERDGSSVYSAQDWIAPIVLTDFKCSDRRFRQAPPRPNPPSVQLPPIRQAQPARSQTPQVDERQILAKMEEFEKLLSKLNSMADELRALVQANNRGSKPSRRLVARASSPSAESQGSVESFE